jgi:NTE family protein
VPILIALAVVCARYRATRSISALLSADTTTRSASRMRAVIRRLGVLAALALFMLAACSSLSVPMNEPLQSAAGNTEYRLLDVNHLGGAESVLVLVALSGGGKRSAAFAHGVLRGMRDIHVRPEGKDSTLIDEIDLLAGVSG